MFSSSLNTLMTLCHKVSLGKSNAIESIEKGGFQ